MNITNLRFRSRILPCSIHDWGMFIATLVLIPAVYIYELCVILPVISEGYEWINYTVTLLGSFVFVNIVANFVGLVVIDTSVPKEVMSVERLSKKWEFCNDCLSYVPPRAWHCKICKICILKRDHHCSFSSSCVGHFNHRFFIMFLLFVNVATLYCVISESVFLFSKIDFWNVSSVIKIILPFCAVIFGLETFQNEICIAMYLTVWAAFIFTCVLLRFHVTLILKGQVTHDVSSQNLEFNNGKFQNIKHVLGERWYIAWAFPLIYSSLPCDGINWQSVAELKLEEHKNLPKER